MIDETDKEVARLFYNGWKARKIADRLGITVNNVNYRLQKVRKEHEVKRWWNS